MADRRTNNSWQENADAESSSSPVPMPVVLHEGFTKEQTLFFIDLMRRHIKAEGKGRPKTLEDLNARLTSTRGSKKRLWNVTAEKLSSNFMLSFCPDKVARKWNTLVEAYRKVKDRNAGKETTRFEFYSEIDDLLGGQDDSDSDDVGTSEELDSESWRNLASPELKIKMASPSLNNNCQENSDGASSPSPGTVTVQEGFTKDQTLFLINLMRQHIEDKGEGLPKTLEDLNARLKSARGSKKLLWTDMAEKMASHFTQSFCPDKVARKWCTLVDAYKRVKDNKSSGKLTIRFQFYSEMDDLLGGEDDVVFPDVGTSEEGNSESLRNLLNPNPKIKMTAMRANIYLDENMKMFIDPQRCIPFLGPLYHIAADLTKYYLNEDHTIMVNMVKAGDINTITDTCLEHTDAASSPSPVPVSAHEGFTKDQTLFLIDLMRQHIEAEGEGLPKTLKDLNARLKSAMGSKKQLWTDTAEKMASHFTQSFCPEKVARKWCTLVEAYKIVKDRNRAKAVILGGKVNTRFQFYSEMDDLLRGEEDVDFPVVGTSEGLEVLRPEALRHCSKVTTSTDTASSPATTPAATLTEPPRKYRRVNDEMMQFLRESEEASRRRHEETLAQLKCAQQGFEALMTKLLDKL